MIDKSTELHNIVRENEYNNKISNENEKHNRINKISFNPQIKNDFEKSPTKPHLNRILSNKTLTEITDTFDIMNKEMQANDFFTRLIAMNLSIEEDKSYDSDPSFTKKMKTFLPWDDEYYNGKSKFQLYTNNNFPSWLNVTNKSKIFLIFFKILLRI